MQFPGTPVRAFEAIVDFLYPPQCLICTSPLVDRNVRVCPECRDSIVRLDPTDDLWRDSEDKISRDGLVDGLHSLFLFEKRGALQQALHHLKYGGMHSLGVQFGLDLGRSLAASGRISRVDFVVPVPLHGVKLRERGYNQSEKICSGISMAIGLPVVQRALRKTRHTPSQTALKLHQREANVKGVFNVTREKGKIIRGASILLVDDVLTTGATLRSCAHAMKTAEADSIFCATIAIAR